MSSLSFRHKLLFSIFLLSSNSVAHLHNAHLPLHHRQDDPATTSCDAFSSLVNSCSAATSDFLNLAFTVEASCLCYSGGSYAPSIYDGYLDSCLAYLSTASTSYYSAISGDSLPTDPCAAVGDVAATGAATSTATGAAQTGGSVTATTAAATAAGTGTIAANLDACLSFEAIEASCAAETPSFSAMPFSKEASCLCYTSATYAPDIADGYWGACLKYLSTASPAFYTSLGGDSVDPTPCASAGDVRTNAPVLVTTSDSFDTISSGPASSTESAPTTTFVLSTAAQSTISSSVGRNDADFAMSGPAIVGVLVELVAVVFVL